MKAKFLFIALVLSTQFVIAQKLVCKTGHIWFYSYTPLEVIEAHNHQVVSILDPSNGDLTISLLMQSFEFKRTLMQEHFNENYMESTTYPKGTFKGKITNLTEINLSKDGTYTAKVTGELTMHGVTKTITTAGTIVVKGKEIQTNAKFTVDPREYNIVIPSVVEGKIAKVIDVNVEIPYTAN
jgi:polyisoprenoid-binding protein YceI